MKACIHSVNLNFNCIVIMYFYKTQAYTNRHVISFNIRFKSVDEVKLHIANNFYSLFKDLYTIFNIEEVILHINEFTTEEKEELILKYL